MRMVLLMLFVFVASANTATSEEIAELPILALSDDYQITSTIANPAPIIETGIRFQKLSYPEFNAFEWHQFVEGTASENPPIHDDVASADFLLQFPDLAANGVSLYWNKGSHAAADDFQPMQQEILVGTQVDFASFGGRSSDGIMPYFNLSCGEGGLIFAIGWPGDWKLHLERLANGQIHVRSGLKRTHFRLTSSERLQLPSVFVMGYQGDWIDGQNQFRRWMLRHCTPLNHTPMDLMPVAASVHGMLGFNDTTERNLTALAKDIADLKLPIDTFWLDAGWNEGGFPGGQGNPAADSVRFPEGLAPVGQMVHDLGLRFLCWFEPERAMKGTWVDRQHPDWRLLPTSTPPELRYMENDGFLLVDFANAEAKAWAIESISQAITDNQITIYRQDFNEYPEYFWHTDESAESIGLNEIRYINGLYAFFDELMRRHPDLIIDNCASGGRRMDFEMMRRSVVLWRSDSCWDATTYPRNVQAMSHGLSHWIPLHGLGSVSTEDVPLRSGMGACASFAINYRDAAAVAALRKHLSNYLPIRELFTKDYYPLSAWTEDPNAWLIYQFHDSENSRGMVQAFCQAPDAKPLPLVRLRNLHPEQIYTLSDWDHPQDKTQRSGKVLMEEGVPWKVQDAGQAIVIQYE